MLSLRVRSCILRLVVRRVLVGGTDCCTRHHLLRTRCSFAPYSASVKLTTSHFRPYEATLNFVTKVTPLKLPSPYCQYKLWMNILDYHIPLGLDLEGDTHIYCNQIYYYTLLSTPADVSIYCYPKFKLNSSEN